MTSLRSNHWLVSVKVTLLILMMTVANTHADQQEDSEQNQLKKWMQNAGIAGKKLTRALALCQDQHIESVVDLERVHRENGLGKIGFR